ncbi:3-oxoacyl-ACP reductase FabG [Paenibacillus validus]|uniref:SDR family NAD(P)-dependent oxidoreductase n=1 Tax=Paenibacillus TaxID=44249 RepID=UPI000FDA7D2F|nr:MULTISPECIES: 3-oxoacyl-ACP reductase family protein [Paenibacillus]MED4601629.1 3-oxoacyl-ACP reductase FabG [Paenibacillus validus]MED4605628.1 3-oxoacyl-ACP reductase FabG [Paenibacillus validus]
MKLKGKVAIVTGGGQGIGRAFSMRLAQEGAKVIVADINKVNASHVEEEIKRGGLEAKAVFVDVSNEQSTLDMANETVETYGKIDILVNNAAIFSTIKMKKMEEITGGEWDAMMNVNLKGVFLCSKAVVPVMKKQNSGRIINISSAAVYLGRTDYIHYVASKAGVLGFSGSLAREVGEYNITVNSITPGPTYTEIPRETVNDDQKQRMLNMQSLKRLQVPDDLAGTVVFLSSDDSSFITGQVFNIDGGMNIRI